MDTAINSGTPVGRALVDGLLDSYDSWRHESAAVRRAYDAWVSSDDANRELTYAAYVAALDQEELAAKRYSDELARVQRIAG
jgi:hypothetical protein